LAVKFTTLRVIAQDREWWRAFCKPSTYTGSRVSTRWRSEVYHLPWSLHVQPTNQSKITVLALCRKNGWISMAQTL